MPDDTTSETTGVILVSKSPTGHTTFSLPLGTVLILISAFIGAGGATGVHRLFGVDQEVLDRIERLERSQQEMVIEVSKTKDIVAETFDIVNSAHPVRGRVGVPDPE